MSNYYFQVLGIIDKLNEWNEQLNGFAQEHLDSVWVGAAAIGIIMVIVVWGINHLHLKWNQLFQRNIHLTYSKLKNILHLKYVNYFHYL